MPDADDPRISLLTTPLTRRRFVVMSGAVFASSLLTACMGDDDDDSGGGTPTLVGATRTPESAIETPQAGASPTTAASPAASPPASPTGAAGNADLDRFMALSRALTGFDDLDDTELGQVYYDAIANSDTYGDQLDSLYDKAGLDDSATAVTLDQLESAGAFDDDTRPVADAITTAWYSGTYDTGGGDVVVATYINALAWQATGYRLTGPSTCSGATGNWSAAVA
ncbi:MAG TPA: sugar dehydrogenase complex small subunit [Thermomicrobiales bacterium]|nr:sugar dehydrogenase complex small subunit [Thermomicrobiales bacterium]